MNEIDIAWRKLHEAYIVSVPNINTPGWKETVALRLKIIKILEDAEKQIKNLQ